MTQSDPAGSTDVRMRGFRSRTPVDDVLVWIDTEVMALKSESVSLAESVGRVLATELVSTIDVPAFDRSAMDGFALRADATTGAGSYNPLPFALVGQSMPGQPFDGEVAVGQAVRIMTGAPMPAGSDAVVPAEFATERDGQVEITEPVPSLKHVGRKGEDVTAGSTLLAAGQQLRAQDVGLIASLGQSEVSVHRAPRVRLLITGNELVEPGQKRGQWQIFESNSYIVSGLVPRDGGVLVERVRCPDNREAIRDAITAPGADVILVSGGSSVGREDHAPGIVREAGELPIHGVAMRPSSPAGVGRVDSAFVFLLPGNPVSCLCAYDFFAGRAIRRLAGRSPDWPHPQTRGTLTSRIVSQIGRVDYCRVRVTEQGVEPIALSGASILSSTVRATGFVIVTASSEGCAAGTDVPVYQYS